MMAVARQMGVAVRSATALTGGFSHRAVLVDTGGGQIVMRFGGTSPRVEAALMDLAAEVVPAQTRGDTTAHGDH